MRKAFYILVLSSFAYLAKAQVDAHFSQFYNSPLTLNPALTGLMEGDLRAGVIYRNQWNSITAPFVTFAGYFDVPITKRLKNGDVVGVGLVLFNDKTGSAGFATFTGLVSAAYHKTLGVNKTHVLSAGLQLGISQTRIDLSKAVFQDQVDNTLTPISSSADAANIGNRIYEELNIGLGYSFKFGKRSKLYLGGAAFHITEPKASLLKTSDARLPARAVAHAGMDIGIGDKISILPSFIYMYQAGNMMTNLGVGISYAFTEDVKGLLGIYYRVNDAVIPMIGLYIKGVNFGFSYDINVSNLSQATANRGAFELSLLYILPYKKVPSDNSVIYSPRF